MLVANVVYATSYVVARVTLESVPPATLAFSRLVVGSLALTLFSRRRAADPLSRGERRAIAWMGILGFAGAYVCSNWGIAHSTATNAALLITVEPVAMILLSPWYLGERLSGRGAVGAALTIVGAVVVVVNGIPGVTEQLVPHWSGDLVLVLAGVAYATYSLALGYVAWNWALARVPAPRAAIFLNIQPIVGALLGAALLGEPLTPFTVLGGALVVTGLAVAFGPGPR